MLSREENRILTQIGPGTPMGEVMRRYWMPGCSQVTCQRRTVLLCALNFLARISSPFATHKGESACSKNTVRIVWRFVVFRPQ